MTTQSEVTVILAVFNDGDLVAPCVQSILTQTLSDFELLIIDDGSTDRTPDVLAAIADPRIRLIRTEENRGLTAALHQAVAVSAGTFVARIDADQRAHRERLEVQVDFLEENPDVGIVGSAVEEIEPQSRKSIVRGRPRTQLAIRWRSLLSSPFIHGTVMMRRSLLTSHDLNYDLDFLSAQDYELWTRVLRHTKGANLAAPLVQAIVRDGITVHRRAEQLENHYSVARRTIEEVIGSRDFDEEALRDLHTFGYGSKAQLANLGSKRRRRAALKYLRLVGDFLGQQDAADSPAAKTLKARVCGRVAERVGILGLRSGRVLAALFKLSPTWPARYLGRAGLRQVATFNPKSAAS